MLPSTAKCLTTCTCIQVTLSKPGTCLNAWALREATCRPLWRHGKQRSVIPRSVPHVRNVDVHVHCVFAYMYMNTGIKYM
jgi:hypothetical protein